MRHITKFPGLAAALAAAALILPGAVHAAGGHDAMPGMSAQEHAQMSNSMPGMSAQEHAQMSNSMPGMSAQEHARMSNSMPGMTAEQHAQMSATSGHQHGSASGTPRSTERPVLVVVGGFALLNGLVLAYAAVIRRRPAARKRRATLARVRRAATVASAPAAEEQR